MALHLAVGPKLLHRNSSTDQWSDVTHVAHRYLFEPLALDPDVRTADLLRLIQPNPVLLEVLGRWDVRSLLLQRNLNEAREDGDAAISASANANVTLGMLLDDLVSELSFVSGPRAQALGQEIARQEWTEVTGEQLLGELRKTTSDTEPASSEAARSTRPLP